MTVTALTNARLILPDAVVEGNVVSAIPDETDYLCTSASDPDGDDDGLLDGVEAAFGTDPCASDSDSDGRTDFDEIIGPTTHLTIPVDPDGPGGTDPADSDGDGAPDAGVPADLEVDAHQ